jgi:hypothetical protein
MKIALPLALLPLLAGCGAATAPVVRPAAPIPIPQAKPTAGMERIMGATADSLTKMFGKADLDIAEGPARKMQFGSRICVLDAYLYPQPGKDGPKVSYVDTRQRDGSPIDQASCVAALNRRDGGK